MVTGLTFTYAVHSTSQIRDKQFHQQFSIPNHQNSRFYSSDMIFATTVTVRCSLSHHKLLTIKFSSYDI